MGTRLVIKAVMETALSELGAECISLSKTTDLNNEDLKTQEYLLKMFLAEAKAIFSFIPCNCSKLTLKRT